MPILLNGLSRPTLHSPRLTSKLLWNTPKLVSAQKLGALKDPEVVNLAQKQKRVIVTFDLDFGELYHAKSDKPAGIIVLRLQDQTVESVNQVLQKFLLNYEEKFIANPSTLAVVKPGAVRFIT